MDFYKQYPSGLRLVANKIDGLKTVSFGIMVDVGSAKELPEENGMSHFIEHLLFKGTTNRTALQISEEMDDIGATINAFTTKTYTCFYTKSVFSDLEKCIDVLSDMYFNANFPEEELNRERGVVLEEIKMCEDLPDDVSADLMDEAKYFGQSLGQPILGKAQNINNYDRNSIINFKNKHYVPCSTIISVSGNFDFDNLAGLVQRYFEDKYLPCDSSAIAFAMATYTNKFLYKFKDIEQAHLQVSWPTCSPEDDDSYAVNLLCAILGTGMSGRLYQVIREQNGLAYSVDLAPIYYDNCGSVDFYAGLSPQNVGKVCNLLFAELSKVKQFGVTQKELDRAKTQTINALYMGTESSLTMMRLYGKRLLKGNVVFDPDKEIERIKSVSCQDVNHIFNKYFCNAFASTYVGPKVDGYDAVKNMKI